MTDVIIIRSNYQTGRCAQTFGCKINVSSSDRNENNSRQVDSFSTQISHENNLI